MVELNGVPASKPEWTVNYSYEASFDSLDEAQMYLRSLVRWSAVDSYDKKYATDKPSFSIYSEELGEYV